MIMSNSLVQLITVCVQAAPVSSSIWAGYFPRSGCVAQQTGSPDWPIKRGARKGIPLAAAGGGADYPVGVCTTTPSEQTIIAR